LSTGPFEPYAALRPGDPVAVIAPASGFDRPSFEQGLAVLAARYRPEYDPGIFTKLRYLAGDDPRRLGELTRALADPRIRGVFCARGGYGATRLLGRLRALAPPGPSKPLVGFSDITALHLWLGSHHRMSVHGPVLTQLGRLPPETHAHLFSLLESTQPAADLEATETYVPGVAEGRLLGGNLSVLSRMLGTPWMPRLEDTVLLLEDFGERPYRLDRMWTHLELAGVFARVRGIVLGTFTQCEEKDAPYTSSDVLRELVQATGLPCAAGFPIGHGEQNQPVALGVRVRLDAGARRLTFLEAAAVQGR
jgi:muramoyltetrapeptide carboxypeptidase